MLCWLVSLLKEFQEEQHCCSFLPVEQNSIVLLKVTVLCFQWSPIWYIISFSPKAYSFAEAGDTEKLNCQNTEQNARIFLSSVLITRLGKIKNC